MSRVDGFLYFVSGIIYMAIALFVIYLWILKDWPFMLSVAVCLVLLIANFLKQIYCGFSIMTKGEYKG